MTELTDEQWQVLLDDMSVEDLKKLKTAIDKQRNDKDLRQTIKIGGKAAGMSIEMAGEFLKLLTGKKHWLIYPISKACYDIALSGGN